MKVFLIVSLALSIWSCSSHPSRDLSSVPDLTGTFIGVAESETSTSKILLAPPRRAFRIYLVAVPEEPGSYYGVLLEYPYMAPMFLKYYASQNDPVGSAKRGFLTKIIESAWAYKIVPTREAHKFEMIDLEVVGDQIQASQKPATRILSISRRKGLKHPLEGARIRTIGEKGNTKFVYFPRQNAAREFGGEFDTTRRVYEDAGLKSTWRKEFLPGPYMAAYYAQYDEKKDYVLELKRVSEEQNEARFHLNPSQNKLSRKKRERQFTNKKSAYLEGDFKVSEPIDGMFLFRPKDTNVDPAAAEELRPRIGLFIDVFDATAKGQDVVELAILDPANPKDFLMYFEDYENGEGR